MCTGLLDWGWTPGPTHEVTEQTEGFCEAGKETIKNQLNSLSDQTTACFSQEQSGKDDVLTACGGCLLADEREIDRKFWVVNQIDHQQTILYL